MRNAPSGTSSRAFMAAVMPSWICVLRSGVCDDSLTRLLRVLPLVMLGAVAALGAACVAYGVAVERRWYRLVRHRLAMLPAGPDGPDSLTVLHLSDLHFVRGDGAQDEVPRRSAAGRRDRGDRRLPGGTAGC